MNIMLLFFLIIVLVPVYYFKLDFPFIKILFSKPFPYQNYRFVILAGVVINIFSFMLFNFLMTSEKIKFVQLYNLLRLFLGNGFVLLVLFVFPGDQTLNRISVYYLIEAFLYIGIGTLYFRKMLPVFNFSMAKKALIIGFPTVISAIVGIFYNFSDKFIIEKVGGFKDMAIYNLGSTVSGVILMTFSTFHNIWLPLFYKEKNIKLNYQKTNKAALLLVLGFCCLSAGLWLLTWFLIGFNIISNKYQPVLWMIPVQFAAQILQSITFLYNNYVTYFEKLISAR